MDMDAYQIVVLEVVVALVWLAVGLAVELVRRGALAVEAAAVALLAYMIVIQICILSSQVAGVEQVVDLTQTLG
jgi:hypothetical protein